MSTEQLSCFKAYDIRGCVPNELTLELVRKTAIAFVAEFHPETVCVGYDIRLSSRDMALVLASGLQDAGANVVMLGLCGTEEVYHATFSQGFDGGIMITASHNPADWNGMKLVTKDAFPVSRESLQAIHDRVLSNDLPIALRRGSYEVKNFREEYIHYLLSCLEFPTNELSPLVIVANAGNGCAWPVVEKIASHLPAKFIPIYEQPDGNFPNGVPNPLLPHNREATQQAVKSNNADFGIAWDGDFDRCFFFDESGRFIEGYYIVGLLAETLLSSNPGEKIIYDPRLVWNTQEIVHNSGGVAIQSKTGHAFMKECMRKENALYGGEMSAHHYFRSFLYCDSGMLAWLLLYKLISQSNKKLSELVLERMEKFPVSGEINRSIPNPDIAIKELKKRYSNDALSVKDIDGLSIEFSEWRFNVRKSNTESLLRLNVESRGNKCLMEEKTKEILACIDKFA